MSKKVAVFDIDGTLFRSGLQREVFYELIKMGVVSQEMVNESTVKFREWRHRSHGNAFEEFDLVLVNALDGLLPTLRVSDYEKAAQLVIEKRADNVYVYTRDLIKSLKKKGYFLLAISGSQHELVGPFAKKYGFDAWTGQEWEKDTKLEFFTGKRTYTHTGKEKILQTYLDNHDLTMKDSYAVGDSGGDISVLSAVDHPIAFNPTYELLEKAIENGWKIVVERKNTSYELTKDGISGQHILSKTNAQ
jgi:HAD superfamily hydrolase (TIGR01490 family)